VFDFRLFGTLAVVAMLVGGGVLGLLIAATSTPNPARIAEVTKPGTVMIETMYEGTLTVPGLSLSDKGKQFAKVLASSEEPALATYHLFQGIAKSPMDLLVPVGGEPQSIKGGMMGSGFLVTPDGYMVTNAHVVKAEEPLKQNAAVRAAINTTQGVNASFKRDFGMDLPEDLLNELARALYNFYQQNVRVVFSDFRIYSAMGEAVPGVAIIQKGFPCTQVACGDIIPGKDVAVLKMEGENLPTLPIGDDSALQVGDRIYVIGYPGTATFHPLVEQQQSATIPTLTSGVVSAKRPMAGGWSAIQTDTAFTHGNSGGPALDSQGRVIGLATFGTIDPMTQETVAGMNFIVPMSIVREFLNQSNVQPRESLFTKLYASALDEHGRQHFKQSLRIFNQLNGISPGNPYVLRYITDAQKAIAEGKDRSWEDTLRHGLIGAGLLLLVGGGVFLVMLRRRRHAPLQLLPMKNPLRLKHRKTPEEQHGEEPGENAA
jgi:S1-C subfamily serine protease